MIESDATRLRMIKAVGGVLIRHDGGEFWAIFENEYLAVIDGMVESKGPALTARTSDVQDLPKDTVLDVNGSEYLIKRHEPDGTGMSSVLLKR